MFTSHFDLLRLNGFGHQSFARFATDPSGEVVVFVHGFNGHPVQTWASFDDLLPHEDVFQKSDLFFYGYESLRLSPTVAAATLREDLEGLLFRTDQFFAHHAPEGSEGPKRRLRTVLLVGHSLGAVVCRRALVDLGRNATKFKQQLPELRLALYAPAHSGARILGSAAVFLDALRASALTAAGQQLVPALKDLEPESQLLKALKTDVEAALARKEAFVAAHLVVLAERDGIAFDTPFVSDDAPPEVICGTDHVTVCKPTLAKPRAARLLARAAGDAT